ncbi:MAG: TerB family tellurite resistance protein [Bacteroidales bacterium]|nr:TerB family tellurite resistance protein [Bacteroidales bacterium]
MSALKWIGGVAGWALGGPLGGIIGYFIGKMFDGMNSGEYAVENDRSYGNTYKRQQTHEGDFGISLLVLSAAVMKADASVKRSELDYVKAFFKHQFGQEKAAQYILILKEILQKDINLPEVCQQIRMMMDHASRLQLLHYLFGLSLSDGSACEAEIQLIKRIASYLGISSVDFESIKAMFVKNTESAYKILEISPEASNEEVKKAYKKMAIKYHPDKVSHLGEDVQRQAKEKFQQLNAAYEEIKKERGMN